MHLSLSLRAQTLAVISVMMGMSALLGGVAYYFSDKLSRAPQQVFETALMAVNHARLAQINAQRMIAEAEAPAPDVDALQLELEDLKSNIETVRERSYGADTREAALGVQERIDESSASDLLANVQTLHTISEETDILSEFAAADGYMLQIQMDETAKHDRLILIGLVSACLLTTVAAALWLFLGLLRPLGLVTKDLLRLGSGENLDAFSCEQRRDDLGDMARALRRFDEAGRRARDLVEQQAEAQRQAEASAAERDRMRAESERDALESASRAAEEQKRAVERHVAELNRQISELMSGVLGQIEQDLDLLRQSTSELQEGAQVISKEATDMSGLARALCSQAEENRNLTSGVQDSSARVSAHVARTCDQMATAQSSVTSMRASVDNLTGTAGRIEDTLALIEAIAAQTNLLALNATIEAARAGDAGKGFVVVAGEVKTLAKRTADATASIRSLVEEVSGVTTATLDAIQNLGTAVEETMQLTEEMAGILEGQRGKIDDVCSNATVVNDTSVQALERMRVLEDRNKRSEGLCTDVYKVTDNIRSQAQNLQAELQTILENSATAA